MLYMYLGSTRLRLRTTWYNLRCRSTFHLAEGSAQSNLRVEDVCRQIGCANGIKRNASMVRNRDGGCQGNVPRKPKGARDCASHRRWF